MDLSVIEKNFYKTIDNDGLKIKVSLSSGETVSGELMDFDSKVLRLRYYHHDTPCYDLIYLSHVAKISTMYKTKARGGDYDKLTTAD